MNRKKKTLVIILAIMCLLVAAIVTGIVYYANDYYHADEIARGTMDNTKGIYNIEALDDGLIVFRPGESTDINTGFIFYPGGKVEYTSYAPLMGSLSSRGITCIIVKMPLNLAIYGINKADGIKEQFSDIDSWYVGGHSLGGAAAAMYISEHTEEYDGLVLLGAYSTKDLTTSGLKVISLYGENDLVLNREKYEENRCNLPKDYEELVIAGGNHCMFGDYGYQKGDGAATIDREKQWAVTADAIMSLIEK